jgi:hypothetical protein
MLDTLFQIAINQTDKRQSTPELRVVTFDDAALIAAFAKAGMARYAQPRHLSVADYAAHQEAILADEQELSLYLDALRRQELLFHGVNMHEKKDQIKGTTRGISYAIPNNTYSLTSTYTFTRLGFAFVTACRPPRGSST